MYAETEPESGPSGLGTMHPVCYRNHFHHKAHVLKVANDELNNYISYSLTMDSATGRSILIHHYIQYTTGLWLMTTLLLAADRRGVRLIHTVNCHYVLIRSPHHYSSSCPQGTVSVGLVGNIIGLWIWLLWNRNQWRAISLLQGIAQRSVLSNQPLYYCCSISVAVRWESIDV